MAGHRSGWPAAAVALVMAAMAAVLPAPAAAQSEARLERIETQLRALQRQVFPGGDERYFEPEITPETSPAQPRETGVSTSALTDVLARLEAIEGQLARLTAATEVNENALAALEMRVGEIEARPATAAAGPSGAIAVPDGDAAGGVVDAGGDLAAAGGSGELPPASNPSPERLAQVEAISKPATADRGDDEYIYGFRLWDAGFYPEAQQQLTQFVEDYPDHWRTTYGRNLLGRAFLDAGEPRRAATHFFENYQSNPQADRAPDSLLYLAHSMIELGDTRRACIALAEFSDTYPALAAGRLLEMYDGLLARVDCD